MIISPNQSEISGGVIVFPSFEFTNTPLQPEQIKETTVSQASAINIIYATGSVNDDLGN